MNTRQIFLGVLGVLITLMLWYVASDFHLIDPLYLPGPSVVIISAIDNLRTISLAYEISLFRLLVGFAIGSATGITTGIVIGQVKTLQRSLLPIIDIIRSIPNLAWIPLAIVWFGIGNESKFFVIALATFFPVFTNTYVGVKAVDQQIIRASENLGASKTKMLYKVLLPAASGDMFIGVKLGLQSGIVALIATEVVASTSGLGFIMNQASSYFKSGLLISVILSIGVLGYLVTQLMVRLEGRVARWRVVSGEK